MPPIILRERPTADDHEWEFHYSTASLRRPRRQGPFGRIVSVTNERISLDIGQFPSNRVLNADDPSKFVLLSIHNRFRFEEQPLRVAIEYLIRLFKKGLFLNGVQYRFYGHSNSQLRGRSCFLREADSDEELDERIYAMGSFSKIMNVAKRAKRIGLLFSAAQVDYTLDPKRISDIPDITVGEEVFSDGCGLISKNLAVQLSKAKRVIFRGNRYTPCVFQIRYLGYKGVLMLHPELDQEKKHLVEFRKSMKKFTTTVDHTFSVVGHSRPYTFGRLNNDIIVLLSSLGISDDTILAKQSQYFDWVSSASSDPVKALDFLGCLEQYSLAERALLDGIDDEGVQKEIRRLQNTEIASGRQDLTNRYKSRIMVHKSRRLYGVCDPFQVLKEGEVYIRVTMSRHGPTTPIHGDVIIVRNPCLHPGDILKLRATHHPKLAHLTDCLVFASTAKLGRHAPPSMSSGGDLDGDEFFVCWDSDLVPKTISESYDYPGNKEITKKTVTRLDLATHFASYNALALGRVSALHAKWARSSLKGALCVECQELNALHSQCVDGANIKIPERLTKPPEQEVPFILDRLEAALEEFGHKFAEESSRRAEIFNMGEEDGKLLLQRLLNSQQNTISEYELFNLAYRLCNKNGIDIKPFLAQLDFSALTTAQKHEISTTLSISSIDYPEMWNSLVRSDILTPRDLYQRDLARPFALHRLYSAKASGLTTFFEYMRMAVLDYTRKLIIIQPDSRFSVGIFIRGPLAWDEDPEVSDNVVVVSFLPQSAATVAHAKSCTTGYRLHAGEDRFQLYNKNIGDTFVFISRRGQVSIALQKISGIVQRQVGRLQRTELSNVEIHVVSNRDRVAHELFDLWFDHVSTENFVRRFERTPVPYRLNDLNDVDWEDKEFEKFRETFIPLGITSRRPHHTSDSMDGLISRKNMPEVEEMMAFGLRYHAEDELFLVFASVASREPFPHAFAGIWIDRYPPLVFSLLKLRPPDDDLRLRDELEPIAFLIFKSIIKSANDTRIAALVALEKTASSIGALDVRQYTELLMFTALSVRSKQLVQEVLLVLNDSRMQHCPPSLASTYCHKHALGVAFDRAEEAADECPCNEDGRPRKKQGSAPIQATLKFTEGYETTSQVVASIRIDARSPIRLHSHVRIQAASKAENRWIDAPIMDGLVVQALKGELKIRLLHQAPPEMEVMDWNIYDAGSTATAYAMMDAIERLVLEKSECNAFYNFIVGETNQDQQAAFEGPAFPPPINLNGSQVRAMNSWRNGLALIWGPPGTGKTEVIVNVLRDIVRSHEATPRILMTASTHNAVDNVLERFIRINEAESLIAEDQVLRVATDQSKVDPSLQHFTINARVGGDTNQNNRLLKQAQERLDRAKLVFTTCAGAGLGILRKATFDIALIDEASQITEPCALIPLVKNIKRAVIVGDHVQLRPTVRNMAKALEFDVSLLERLYTKIDEAPGLSKTMLDIQYRSPRQLNAFPSAEFYEGRLQTYEGNAEVSNFLAASKFPWPIKNGVLVPTVFVNCDTEEDMGSRSKSNQGQVELINSLLPLLTTQKDNSEAEPRLAELKVTVLSPYTKQIQALRNKLPGSITCSTVDSFQGRESDIVIFSAVRSNVEGDVGFLDDPRRLNVMWTRARCALIIVGHRQTMSTNALWKRALDNCTEVTVADP